MIACTKITQESPAQTAKYTKATVGENTVQKSPAIPEAMIFPKLCTVASNPKADPRRSAGARRPHSRAERFQCSQ